MVGKARQESSSVPETKPSFHDVFDGRLNPNLFRANFSEPPRQRAGLTPLIRIGRQWYRQIDNGRATLLVPVVDPWTSPAELAQRRAAIDRAAFIAENPLAGVAYTLATLARTSPQVRDRAMVAGGAMNTALLAAAPIGARAGNPVGFPPTQPAFSTSTRDPRRFGPLNENGQATGVNATITKPLLGTGTRVNQQLEPPDWRANGNTYRQDRGHLLAKRLGGAGNTLEEVVTLDRRTNRGQMSRFEGAVARRVRKGEVVEYFVNPLYGPGSLAPSWIAMTAYGSRGSFTPAVIQNPASRPR